MLLNYSLEFVGGTSTTADFGKDYTAAEVEKDIVPSVSKLLGNSAVQVTTVQGSHDVTLKTRTLHSMRDRISQLFLRRILMLMHQL